MAEAMSTMLTEHHLTVLRAHTAADALRLFDSGAVDAVLCDVRLPDGTWFDILAHVRKRAPDVPVIMTTAHGCAPDAVSAIRDGAFDYILKPVDIDQFDLARNRAIAHIRLRDENRRLRVEPAAMDAHGNRLVAGHSPHMQATLRLAEQVAPAN